MKCYMDDKRCLDIIQCRIDQTFVEAHKVEFQYRSIDFGHQMYLFCNGYVLACVNFGLISVGKYDEFMEQCKIKQRGL